MGCGGGGFGEDLPKETRLKNLQRYYIIESIFSSVIGAAIGVSLANILQNHLGIHNEVMKDLIDIVVGTASGCTSYKIYDHKQPLNDEIELLKYHIDNGNYF